MSEDLTQKLPSSPDGTLAQILTVVQNLSTRLESLEQRFGSLEQRFENLEHRFGNLEQKVEGRLYDTRPIWEKVQADIAGLQEGQRSLQEGQNSLQEGQDALRKDVRELNTHWRDMNRKLSIFNDTLTEIQADYRDIYDRVRGLERQSS
jgi:chromosome segregation ATPase